MFSEFKVEAVVCVPLAQKTYIKAAALQGVFIPGFMSEVQQVAFHRHGQQIFRRNVFISGHIFITFQCPLGLDNPSDLLAHALLVRNPALMGVKPFKVGLALLACGDTVAAPVARTFFSVFVI